MPEGRAVAGDAVDAGRETDEADEDDGLGPVVEEFPEEFEVGCCAAEVTGGGRIGKVGFDEGEGDGIRRESKENGP